MDNFEFRIQKGYHKDGREGLFLLGKHPDHCTPMKKINKFLGKNVLEMNGSGIGVNLFLPEAKLDDWQKLALHDKAWGKEPKNSKGVFILHLDKIKKG